VDLRQVCPIVVQVADADAECNSTTTWDPSGTGQVETIELSMSIPQGSAFGYFATNDNWYVEILYVNNCDDTGGDCTPLTSSDIVDIDDFVPCNNGNDDELFGGDHEGFVFHSTGATTAAPQVITADGPNLPTEPVLFSVANNYCPSTLSGNSGDNGGSVLFTGNGTCSPASIGQGTNDYFIMTLDAQDFYDMYGGKDAFLTAFLGNNCNAASEMQLVFAENTGFGTTDLSMNLVGMEIYNYKEDATAYIPELVASNNVPAATGDPDMGFDVSPIPTWVANNGDDIINVTDPNGGAWELGDCLDVSLDLSQLETPDCDDTCYDYSITHTIHQCTGGCAGDGVYTYTREFTIDKEPNLMVAQPEDYYVGIGCVSADAKPEITLEEFAMEFGFTTDVCNTSCTVCPASCSPGCFANGTVSIPDPFNDYVVQDGISLMVLPNAIDDLLPIVAADPSVLESDYPADNVFDGGSKRLYIPVDYTVTSACEICPPETERRHIYIVRPPVVDLDIPDSPGVCAEEITVIPLDPGCEWGDCVYNLTITNASTVTIIGGTATDLQTAAPTIGGVNFGSTLVDTDGDNIPETSVPSIELAWDDIAAITETLFGDFTVSLEVICGSPESYCSDEDSQLLNFLGEVDGIIQDVEVPCFLGSQGAIGLNALFTTGTSTGGNFNCLNCGSDASVVGGQLFYNAAGCYEIVYSVSTFGNVSSSCAETDTAFIYIPEEVAPLFSIQEQICWSVNDPLSTSTYTPYGVSSGPNKVWSVTGPATVDAATGTIVVNGAGLITLTLTETANASSCSSLNPSLCSDSYTLQIDVQNGTALDASFDANVTPCLLEAVDLIPITPGGTFTGIGIMDNGSSNPNNVGQFIAAVPGEYVITYTLNSSNGCSNVYSIVITVDEQMPTSASCESDVTLSSPATSCGAMHTYAIPTFDDDCDGLGLSGTLVSGLPSGSMFPIGSTIVTYSFTDSAGNGPVFCSFTVHVVDDVAPALACPPALSLSTDAGSCSATVATFAGSVSDNCGISTMSYELLGATNASGLGINMDGQSFNIGTTQVVLIAEDIHGNVSTCSVDVTVSDNELPAISCPSSSVEACTVDDVPAFTNLAQFMNSGGSVEDNCGINNSSFTLLSESSDGGSCPEIISRVYEITDMHGNASSCTHTISINDNTAPVINSNSGNISLGCYSDFNQLTADINFYAATANVTDNCSFSMNESISLNGNVIASINGVSPSALSCDGNSLDISIIATDLCGNSGVINQTMLFDFDDESPSISGPDNVDLGCISSVAEVAAIPASMSISDNCSFTLSYNDVDVTDSGCESTVQRTYTVEDPCGNSSTFVQILTYTLDSSLPSIVGSVSSDIGCFSSVFGNDGLIAALNQAIDGVDAIDGCSGVTLSSSIEVINEPANSGIVLSDPNQITADLLICNNTVNINYTATDPCGNTVDQLQVFTFRYDETAPTISCPADIYTCNDKLSQGLLITNLADFISAGGSINDNCTDILDLQFTVDQVTTAGFAYNTLVNTFTVTDECGNSVSCTQEYNYVNYLQAPTVSSPSPQCTNTPLPNLNPGGGVYNFYWDDGFGSPGAPLSMCSGVGSCPPIALGFSIDVTAGGTHTLWVAEMLDDGNGGFCESEASQIVITIYDPIEFVYEVSCDDGSGTVDVGLIPSNGVAPYTIQTNGFYHPAGNLTFSPTTPGSVTVILTDANGCASEPVVIDVYDAVTASSSVDCFDTATGGDNVTFTPSGGLSPYRISYDGGASYEAVGDYVHSLSSGSYSIVVADSQDPSCTYTESITVADCATSEASMIPNGTTVVCYGTTASIVSMDGDIAPGHVETYYLYDGSLANIVASSSTGLFVNDGSLPAGDYTVVSAIGPADANGYADPNNSSTVYSNAALVRLISEILFSVDEICDPATGEFTVDFSIAGGYPEFPGVTGAYYNVSGEYTGPVTPGTTITAGPFPDGIVYTLAVDNDQKGCTASYSGMVECTTSPLKAGLGLTEVTLYPNPATDQITLEFETIDDNSLQMQIINLEGKLVKSDRIYPNAGFNSMPFDISDLEAGIYTIKIDGDAIMILERFIIK